MTTIVRGYKSAGEYIIELYIDTTIAYSNLNRIVVNKDYAKYRCSSAFVKRIYHKHTKKEINEIESDRDFDFIYKKGENINVINYDKDINKVSTIGIHFYLSEEAAFFNNLTPWTSEDNVDNGYTGNYMQWYDNGQLKISVFCINGKMEGLCYMYDADKMVICNYKNDKRSGQCIVIFNDGYRLECHYTNGEIIL